MHAKLVYKRKNDFFFSSKLLCKVRVIQRTTPKVQECVGTPFIEGWSIIEQAKIKDFHTTITHIDNKIITVWLFHKQKNKTKKKNVGFFNIFACGKACFSSIKSVTFFSISGTSSHMALCRGFPQGSGKSYSTIHFKLSMMLVGLEVIYLFIFG